MSPPKVLPTRTALIIWATSMLALTFYGIRYGLRGHQFVVFAGVTAWLLGVEIILASGGLIDKINARVNRAAGAALIVVPIVVYWIYAVGTGSFSWGRVGLATAYALAPTLLAATAGEAKFGCLQDYASLFVFFFPYWRGWLLQLWVYPDHKIGWVYSSMFAIQVGIVVFFLVRRADRTGYAFNWARGWSMIAAGSFLVAAAVIIPLSMLIHFTRFDASLARPLQVVPQMLGMFLFIAWGEEFFYRGLLQNALQRTLRNEYAGWAVASIIFGLSHIRHGRYPNWRYVFLATLAGVIYGFAWRKTGSMTVSATIHMAVDLTWHQLFRTL
jgi:membrane protease YdiL (CAAX protease family)